MIIFCYCGRKADETKDTNTIRAIDLLSEPATEITRISDVATNIEYVPLKTIENSLLKSITKIVTCDNIIYIRSSLDDIFCFDNKGNFLYNLNKTGRGPGEYTYIVDFDISSDNKALLVLSTGNILLFNITGTEFTFNTSISLMKPYPSKISMIPGTTNILLSIDPATGSEQALSILINANGDTLYFKPNHYMFENKSTRHMHMINESLHYNFGNRVCFKEEFSDTVFFVNSESKRFQPRLILDSHGKGGSPRIRYDTENTKNNLPEYFWVYYIIETHKYIISSYEHNMSRNKVIYDKSSKKKFKIAFDDALEDDINGGPALDPDFCSGNKIYSYIDALTLKEYVTGEEFMNSKVSDPGKKNELKKLADSLKETDNPVLIIVTPKD